MTPCHQSSHLLWGGQPSLPWKESFFRQFTAQKPVSPAVLRCFILCNKCEMNNGTLAL